MRRLVLALRAMSFLAMPLTACWALTSDLDLTGGMSASGAFDAAAALGDASPDGAVVPVDGSRRDGGPANDGGGFCDRHGLGATLCDDFDEGALGAKWTRTERSASSMVSLALDTTRVRSRPNSLLSKADEGCPAGSIAQLLRIEPGKPVDATLELELSLGVMTASTSINLAAIYYNATPSYYRISVSFRNGHIALSEDGPNGVAVLAESNRQWTSDVFSHVKAVFKLVASPRATVIVDDRVEADSVIAPPAPSESQSTLELGLFNSASCTGPIDARFDDVVYRLTTAP